MSKAISFRQTIGKVNLLPVITPNSIKETVEISSMLSTIGYPAVEITLRTKYALDAISAVVSERPELLVGAGTVLDSHQLMRAHHQGAAFSVSPGISSDLLKTAKDIRACLLPGVATASEVMLGVQHGFQEFKFFPADAAGGPKLIRAWAGPFPEVQFCPTGGVNDQNVTHYMDLPNVFCVGGSWMLDSAAVKNQDWDRARDAAIAAYESCQ